ncbi:MAG: LysR family transcriptional regulator, partial [Alphaproteobacteria bacterium]|nr:LysR family transcriptional regulator [Alphaproteobacteria bacterium]
MFVPNRRHLRLCHVVACDGVLTTAAGRLNFSQSALSTQVRALGAALGHDLFERRFRRVILTGAGRIALDHAEAILRTAADLTATLQRSGAGRRVSRIGVLATLSRNFQIGFLDPLIGWADVEIVLRSASQLDLLRGLDALFDRLGIVSRITLVAGPALAVPEALPDPDDEHARDHGAHEPREPAADYQEKAQHE